MFGKKRLAMGIMWSEFVDIVAIENKWLFVGRKMITYGKVNFYFYNICYAWQVWVMPTR
jgi:hypothetical protein